MCVKQIDDHLLDTEFHRPMTSNDFVTNDVSDCEKKCLLCNKNVYGNLN